MFFCENRLFFLRWKWYNIYRKANKRYIVMRFLIALDSFKGSLSSYEAGTAAAEGIRRAIPDAEILIFPMADGGEGTIDALATMGGKIVCKTVTGPIGLPVNAKYLILNSGTAVLEMSSAAGLPLVPPEKRNPLYTTTRGVGELILDAHKHGCYSFLIGIGGSATNDGGAGMLRALGVRLFDADRKEIRDGAAGLTTLETLDLTGMDRNLESLSFSVACDVTNPLCGPLGASAIFAPQKGAKPEDIPLLDEALARFAKVTKGVYPEADDNAPGAGAAGGLGFALRTYLHAELKPGAPLVMKYTGLTDSLREGDIVIVGEGRIDAQTMMGKAPICAAREAKMHGCVVIGLAGSVTPDAVACHEFIDAIFPILPSPCSLADALDKRNAADNLSRTAEEIGRLLIAGRF